jgi:hypothetical protein
VEHRQAEDTSRYEVLDRDGDPLGRDSRLSSMRMPEALIKYASSYPSYAQDSVTGNSNYVATTTSTDPRALQEVGSSNRIAAVWYSPTSFTVNVNLTDGQTHQLALYLLDWIRSNRSEQIQMLDATTPLPR